MPISIEVEGLGHGTVPIPMAAVQGGILVTGGVNGRDINTREMPDAAAEQWRNCLSNLVAVLKAANMTLDEVVKIDVHMKDDEYRSVVNGPWVEYYPDPERRPARHIHVGYLSGTMKIQLVAMAVANPGK